MWNVPNQVKASDEYDKLLEEYEKDEQFQMMVKEYGEDYAKEFIGDVIAKRKEITPKKGRDGGGNICYKYVKNIKQTKKYNCGSTTVLQTLYGMNRQGAVSGTSDSAKIGTLDAKYNVDGQGSMYVYQVRDALNTFKSPGVGNYVYQLGSSVTQATFEQNIATALTNAHPIILHAKTEYFSYYGGKSSGHYLSLDYVNRTSDYVRIVDCNYNNAYYGVHTNVPLSQAYKAVSASGRYYIY